LGNLEFIPRENQETNGKTLRALPWRLTNHDPTTTNLYKDPTFDFFQVPYDDFVTTGTKERRPKPNVPRIDFSYTYFQHFEDL